ncbi:uroporphyrinogen-III C-methyltransferase [Echinimonas agarilytica]|uniref:Uroporphyrinogen-III C-methyltransferase n=1 Tax=Echinimonas agarilytica TaxID=1215918 RepID=A0AA42B6B4_9GAMM|nr:uroporphyrinogen-III C-methyltransferase [Echinimonas agarilytica]MCM2678251.1 uroporphyrinogen-III C-methyltransferase [Echinimonas agarilytica]
MSDTKDTASQASQDPADTTSPVVIETDATPSEPPKTKSKRTQAKTAQTKDSAEASDGSSPKAIKPSNGKANTALVLSIITIALLILSLSAITIIWPEWEKQLKAASDFQTDMKARQQETLQAFNAIQQSSASQEKTYQVLQGQVTDALFTQQRIQQRLQQFDGRNSSEWVLAEVDYLIRLSTRKLWIERDVNSAIALLKSADLRVSELHDASLTPLRRSLNEDIAMLRALPLVDINGIALMIDGLISQIDSLPINTRVIPESIVTEKKEVITDDPSDWRSNLMHTWHSFIDGFISVSRRSDDAKPLLAPDQRWYLAANIRLSLQQAQLAAMRSQPMIYRSSLTQADQWISQYFDNSSSTVSYVREALAELAIAPVQIELPQDLSSRRQISGVLNERNVKASTPTESTAPGSESAEPEPEITAPAPANAPQSDAPQPQVELEQDASHDTDAEEPLSTEEPSV